MNFCWCLCIPANNNCDSPELPHGAGPDMFIQYYALGSGDVQSRQLQHRAQRRPAMGSLASEGGKQKGGILLHPVTVPEL